MNATARIAAEIGLVAPPWRVPVPAPPFPVNPYCHYCRRPFPGAPWYGVGIWPDVDEGPVAWSLAVHGDRWWREPVCRWCAERCATNPLYSLSVLWRFGDVLRREIGQQIAWLRKHTPRKDEVDGG